MLVACAPPAAGPTVYDLRGATMGTQFSVKVILDGDTLGGEAALQLLVERELALVDDRMSHYRADSEVSRFNRHAATTPFEVSAETFEVIAEAQRIAELTGGAFDITVGPLVEAWGFGASSPETPPSDAEVEALRRRLGFGRLRLDADALTIQKDEARLAIDLSAIAKGYGVDRVAEALESGGVERYMVEVGGEVRTAGLNAAGEPWRIAVEHPDPGAETFHRVLPLSGWAMATSGDYRNVREWEGRRLSHMIEPRTGRPVDHALASVTVVADRCMSADGLATAVSVLGPEAGFRFATTHDIAALLLVRTSDGRFEERVTPAFRRLLASWTEKQRKMEAAR